MDRLNLRTAVALAGSLAALVSCGRQANGRPPVATSASTAPTPAVSSTAGRVTGTPIDASTLTGRITFSGGTDDIWTVNADGSGLKRLTLDPGEDFDPSWSPDGRLIAFRSMRDGNNEIYVMRADGSGQHNVSRDRTEDWGPAWSPDGEVVWNCQFDLSAGFRACVSGPDGRGARRIPVGRYFEYPAWSPDGTKIAFSSTRDDCSNSSAADCRTTGDIGPYQTIYVMNADGSDQHRLSLQLGQFVDWSPDGRYLVFSPGLQVIRPDGTGLTSINVAVGAEPEFADWGR